MTTAAQAGSVDVYWPKINGVATSYAQMGLLISALPGRAPMNIIDVKAVDYGVKVDMRFLHLSSSFPVGRYERRMEATGSIEFGIETHRAIVTVLTTLGLGGFTDVAFDIPIIYQLSPGSDFLLDTLHGCRFTGFEQRNQTGGKHLSTTCGLSIAWVELDGSQATSALTVVAPETNLGVLSPTPPNHVG